MAAIEHFWSPPEGESILGMTTYRDMIIVATTGGVYVIKDKGRGLDDHEVVRIRPEFNPKGVLVNSERN